MYERFTSFWLETPGHTEQSFRRSLKDELVHVSRTHLPFPFFPPNLEWLLLSSCPTEVVLPSKSGFKFWLNNVVKLNKEVTELFVTVGTPGLSWSSVNENSFSQSNQNKRYVLIKYRSSNLKFCPQIETGDYRRSGINKEKRNVTGPIEIKKKNFFGDASGSRHVTTSRHCRAYGSLEVPYFLSNRFNTGTSWIHGPRCPKSKDLSWEVGFGGGCV